MMCQALRSHWPEYCMEAAGLGVFMISAGCSGRCWETLARRYVTSI